MAIAKYSERVKKGLDEADKITKDIWAGITREQKNSTAKVDFTKYAGTYHDRWFGDVILSQKGEKYQLQPVRSSKLTGELFYYKGNTFVVKWNNRSFDADAYVTFQVDDTMQPVSIKMKPISPLTDFSRIGGPIRFSGFGSSASEGPESTKDPVVNDSEFLRLPLAITHYYPACRTAD